VGKVHHASEYVRLNQTDLAEAYFYSDSHSDLPLMNAVGNPVAVNPDFRLARVAKRAGWPIRRWQALRHPPIQR
jgi:phosphoserine phosphatase